MLRLLLALATFPVGSKTITRYFSSFGCVHVLFILLSGIALTSGESYITDIWKWFSLRKNLSDVQSEKTSLDMWQLCPASIQIWFPGCFHHFLKKKKKWNALKGWQRETERQRELERDRGRLGRGAFPVIISWRRRCPPLPVFSRVSDTVQVTWTVNTVDLLCRYRHRDITLLRPSLKLSVGCLRETLQCCHLDLHLWTCPGRSTGHWPDCTARTEDITWGFYKMELWVVAGRKTTPMVRNELFFSLFLRWNLLLGLRFRSKLKIWGRVFWLFYYRRDLNEAEQNLYMSLICLLRVYYFNTFKF